jgi:hypothetical protein
MKPGTAACPILPMGELRLLYYHGFRRVGIQEKRQTPSIYEGRDVLRRKPPGSGKKLTQNVRPCYDVSDNTYGLGKGWKRRGMREKPVDQFACRVCAWDVRNDGADAGVQLVLFLLLRR